jgi:two-component system cell cycle response regulator CtrA
MKILVVMSDEQMANVITGQIRMNGWRGYEAYDLDDAKTILRTGDYDVVVLGQDVHGIHAIHEIRRETDLPLVYLGLEGDSIEDKVNAFNAGADDVLPLPVQGREFWARLQAVVRRSRGLSHGTITIGEVELDMTSRTVKAAGKELHLTGKEYQLLEALMMRQRIMTKEALLDHLYGGIDEPEVKIIDVFICKVRKKLRERGVADIIQTVWGRGYHIAAEAQEAAA